MGQVLDARRDASAKRLDQLTTRLAEAEAIAASNACVYATGSFARGESSAHSDLDLFIVGRTDPNDPSQRLLRRLDEICIKSELIKATRALSIPEFSGDGTYLNHYTVSELVASLGTPDDDSLNTFTARLLLLLESKPLIGRGVYDEAIGRTIAAYWRDYDDHETDFMPAFLANDVLRLWRTFCVNYEARTATDPDRKRAKRRLKKYKLKHSRLLTCYSALLFLVAKWREQNTVRPVDAIEMVELTPTGRIEFLMKSPVASAARSTLAALLAAYERFLEETNVDENTLIDRLLDRTERQKMLKYEDEFGDLMFRSLQQIGADTRFYRMLVT